VNTIFYFTGTGNSLKFAKDIAANVEDSSLVPIAASMKSVSDLAPQGVVGFVFPVYYCGLPRIVCEFISAINLDRASYVYIACTYGATSGNGGCISQTKRILKERGFALNAAFYVKMVDNFILWSWDVPPVGKHAKLHENARRKSVDISKIITNGQNHFDRSITEHITPVIYGYKHFYQTVNHNDKAFNTSEKCTSCGLCADICPTHNLGMDNGKPIWKSENCQRCLACLHLCPSACIQYGKATAKRQRYKNPYIAIDEFKKS